MATNPVGSWLTGGGVTGRGGAPAPVAKAVNPIVQQIQAGAPVGGWGDMGMQKGAIAALNAPAIKAMPSGPPPIAEALKAQAPAPNLAAAMAPQQSYFEANPAAARSAAASAARAQGTPAPAPAPPPAPAAAPALAAPEAVKYSAQGPSIAQNMGMAGAAPAIGGVAARMRELAGPAAPAGPQYSDPYEAAKQARLGGRGR